MLYKPLYEYNKARSSFLLPSVAYGLVIDCRSLSTPITQPSSRGRHSYIYIYVWYIRKALCKYKIKYILFLFILFVVYIIATSKVISGMVLTCDSVHSWWCYSAAPLGNLILFVYLLLLYAIATIFQLYQGGDTGRCMRWEGESPSLHFYQLKGSLTFHTI